MIREVEEERWRAFEEAEETRKELAARKKRLSDVDKHFQRLDKLYGPLLQSLDFSMDITVGAPQPGTKAHGIFLGENADYHLVLQRFNLQAARQQASGALESADEDADRAFEGALGPNAL